MKTKNFILAPIFLGVSLALAGAPSNEPKEPVGVSPLTITTSAGAQSGSVSSADASAVSSAAAVSGSSATSGSTASGGDAKADANSGGNVFAPNTVYEQRQQAPALFASSGNTTAGCEAAWNFGVTTPVGGVVGGKSKTRRDCVLFAAAEAELARGNQTASIKLRCKITYYVEALGDDCEALLKTQTQLQYATKSYVNESVKRAFEASQRK